MSIDQETTFAEHFLSLIDKKTIWELDILCSILNVNVTAFIDFIKDFPMAYGLSLQGKRLYVTQELVRDVVDEIKESCSLWYQRTAPSGFSQISQIGTYKKKDPVIDDTPERVSPKIKISVYGNNYIVEDVLNNYLTKIGLTPSFDYTGGYEPVDFQKNIGNNIYNCQFMLMNYNRDIKSFAPLLYELPEGFLFIFNPNDKLQIDRLAKIVQVLISKRTKDILIVFLAIVDPDVKKDTLDDVSNTLSYLVEFLEGKDVFKVSFAILSSPDHVERKINDLIQYSRMLF